MIIPEKLYECKLYPNIVSLGDVPYTAKVIGYCRVSKPDYAWRLPQQSSKLAFDVWFDTRFDRQSADLVALMSEVHTGTTLDRPVFNECIARALREGLIIVASDIHRLVRHPEYGRMIGGRKFLGNPLPDQLAKLCSYGVTFALAIPWDSPSWLVRSSETKRGMSYGKPAGRPKGITDIDSDLLRNILWLLEIGASSREIEHKTGVNYKRIQRIATESKGDKHAWDKKGRV